jgi:nitrogen fixation protein NifZ
MSAEDQAPRYQWGQQVRACQDLFNDGSYPEHEPDELLVTEGAAGEIVQVGSHVESNTPIYLVEFPSEMEASRVVGCFEEEIAPL